VQVIDNGIGIHLQDQDQLFKEFGRILNAETLRMNPQGNGLGLWICTKLCQSVSGQPLKLQSSYGTGSTFSFAIALDLDEPLAPSSLSSLLDVSESRFSCGFDEKELTEAASFPLPESLSGRTAERTINFSRTLTKGESPTNLQMKPHECHQTVMVVDDDMINRFVLSKFLENQGLTTEIATNGVEALELIKNRSSVYENCECSSYKLIIMDYEMPELNGPNCCTQITQLVQKGEITPQVVIGHTAYSSQEDIDYFRSCGVADILEKPISESDFQRIVQRWLQSAEPDT